MCYIFGFILILLLSYCYRLVFCINMVYLKKYLCFCLNFFMFIYFFYFNCLRKGCLLFDKKKLKKKF